MRFKFLAFLLICLCQTGINPCLANDQDSKKASSVDLTDVQVLLEFKKNLEPYSQISLEDYRNESVKKDSLLHPLRTTFYQFLETTLVEVPYGKVIDIQMDLLKTTLLRQWLFEYVASKLDEKTCAQATKGLSMLGLLVEYLGNKPSKYYDDRDGVISAEPANDLPVDYFPNNQNWSWRGRPPIKIPGTQLAIEEKSALLFLNYIGFGIEYWGIPCWRELGQGATPALTLLLYGRSIEHTYVKYYDGNFIALRQTVFGMPVEIHATNKRSHEERAPSHSLFIHIGKKVAASWGGYEAFEKSEKDYRTSDQIVKIWSRRVKN